MLPPPKKKFGQHFLHDENVVARIIRAVPDGHVPIIEIGVGRGALTAHLVQSGRHVVAVEYDRELIPVLCERFAGCENFILVEADALEVDFCSLASSGARACIVANLPYNIGTAILTRLIEQRACIAEMVLMLQREVVERITAVPSEPKKKGNESGARGFLSVFVEAYCETEVLFDVPPGAFSPPPKVWSTVVRLRPRPKIAVDVVDELVLWQIVSAGFAQRRKTIHNNLRGAPSPVRERIGHIDDGANALLNVAGVEPTRRAETLTLEEWGGIANALSQSSEPIVSDA